MRNPFKNSKHQVFWWVFSTHAAVIFLMLTVPWVKGLFRPKPKEIVTFVEMAAPGSAAPSAVESVPEPAPPPPAPSAVPEPPRPKPEPPPKPVPKPKPEPPKPTPKPEPEPEPPKPKWKPAEVVPQNRRVSNPNVTPQPQRKQLDVSGVRQALQGSSGTVNPFAAYYSQVQQRVYSIWQQPSGTPVGTRATAIIRVEPDGSVSYKTLSRPSGNPAFDRSVQTALTALTRLPAPPADLPDRNITVEFVLSQ
jgi:TonB family protein